MTHIRPEQPKDIPAIWQVNSLAFGRPDEANLVDNLRRANALAISLVAENEGQIIGHIAFFPHHPRTAAYSRLSRSPGTDSRAA